MKRTYVFLILLFFFVPVLRAQQTSFYGTVKDSTGAVIVNARIEVSNVSGGPLFTASTNSRGDYQLPAISAATYKLVSTANGFKPVTRTITILVGQSLQADFTLGLSSASEQVEVSASSATMDVTTSQVAGVIDPGKMTELPLNGRNYLQLGTVVPGVRVNAVTSSLLTSWNVGGQQINLDGQQTLENSRYMAREAVPLFSRDAIAEFQVTTNRFDATQGGSAQILLNLQSKSGSNKLHGSAFAYFRNDAFDAADPITKTVLSYNDRQYGGTIGGPVRKDKTYYFGSYEGERQPYTLVLTPYGFSSVYPTWTHPATNTVDEYLARFDHVLRPQDHLSLRISAYKQYTPFVTPPSGGLTNPTYLSDQRTNGYTPLLTWTATRGPNIVNDLKIGFNHTGQQLSPFFSTMTLAFPSTSIGGYYYDPDHSNSEKQSYRDDFYWLHGKNNFKIGAEYSYVPYHGVYNMYSRGVAVMSQDLTNLPDYFPNLFDYSTWDLVGLSKYVSSYTQAFGTEQYRIPVQNVGVWIQDDWKASRQLTLNFGIRYDNNIGVWDPQTVLKSGLKQQEHGDNHDFGPRIGFAWSPGISGKTVIRGGAGLYYANVPVNPIQDAVLFNGERTVLPTVTASKGNLVNLASPYGSTTAAQILADPNAWKQTVQVMAASGLETPWNAEVSVGAQSKFFKYFMASADYLHNRTHHMWMRSDKNLYYDATTGYNKAPGTYGRPNATYASILTFETPDNVGSIYDALLVSLQQENWHGLNTNVAYTFSREKSNGPLGPFGYANNPFNFHENWGNSPDDQRNTLNVTANYAWKFGLHGGLVYHYGSGANAYVTAGASPTGLGAYTSNRTYCGVDATNSSCPTTRTVVYNDKRHNHLDPVSGFDITDQGQFYGRSIHHADVNLAKDTRLWDHAKGIIQVEAFNVFNHTNYGSYNTVITSATFGKPTASTGVLFYYARMLQFSARVEF